MNEGKRTYKLLYMHLLLTILAYVLLNLQQKPVIVTKVFIGIFTLIIFLMLIYLKIFKVSIISLNRYFIFLSILFSILIINIDNFSMYMMQTTIDMPLYMSVVVIIINILLLPFTFLVRIIYDLGFINYSFLIIPIFLLSLYLISKKIIK